MRRPGDEMPPAGVERDGEVGIGLASHLRGKLGRVVEPAEVDPPAFDSAFERDLQHLVRPLAHGGRRQQAAKRVRAILHPS
jgi:hypothetical protein